MKRAVLGANDPEMKAIETVCRAAGLEVVYASHEIAGKMVRILAGSAYGYLGSEGEQRGPTYPEPTPEDIWIECAPAQGGKQILLQRGCIIIDHHAPGDPGFDKSPIQFWEGSSLGQICMLLKIEPTPELLLAAACDHAPAAAYRGEIPGITPQATFDYQTATIAQSMGKPVGLVRKKCRALRKELRFTEPKCITTETATYEIVERFDDVMSHYLDFLCLREAALFSHKIVVLKRFANRAGKKGTRVMMVGHAPPPLVQYFLDGHLYPGLTDRFGVPERGYAGGYQE